MADEDFEEVDEEEEDTVDKGVELDENGEIKIDESTISQEAEEAADVSDVGAKRLERASPYGGLRAPPGHNPKMLRTVGSKVIKELGKKLFSGHLNLTTLSLPVELFEKRSYLEKVADTWIYPQYLDMAAARRKAGDPLGCMKFMICFGVAGIHQAFNDLLKPFNPILGETFQATFAASDATINVEQVRTIALTFFLTLPNTHIDLVKI